jgi:lysophospholipase L1-like esterase
MNGTISIIVWAGLCAVVVAALPAMGLAAPAAPRPLRVACVGDSLTSGFKMDKPGQDGYPAQLGRLLGTGYEVRAFAVPGRTALKRANLPLWKEPLFADAQAWGPDMVVLCLGTNDAWPAIWQQLRGEFPGDLRAMVALFAGLPSHPRVWLCVPPPLFCDGIEVQQRILLQEISPAIRAVARETGCGLIDLYAPLAGHVELFMDDKVHPLAGAAAVMAQAVAGHVSRPTKPAPRPAWLPLKKRDVVVCLGDATTEGVAYGHQLQRALHTAGKPAPVIVSAGVGGDTLPQLAARFTRDVAPSRPRVVIVSAGTNDALRDVSPDGYEKALREIVAQTKSMKAQLVLLTPCPLANAPAEARTRAYTARLRAVAAETGCLVAEDYALLCQARACGLPVLLADGIHLNLRGHALLARAVLDALGYQDMPMPVEAVP